jgi:hypothetical protein
MSSYLKSINALYAMNYVRRTKTCSYCGIQYCDITKRNVKNTCTNLCTNAQIVATRRLKNSYAQSEESKEKKRISVKATYASRDVFGPELRKKLSENMKKNWAEGKIDTSNHWAKTESGKKKISNLLSGKKHTEEARKNMSMAAQARLRTKRERMYTSAKGGMRDDLQHYFRSSWEANFARILNHQGKKWEYEPTTFQLSETQSYTPDFYCEGVYFEIKGRPDEKSRNQLELMAQLFPDVKIEVIDGVKYEVLRLHYKLLLQPLWEGK